MGWLDKINCVLKIQNKKQKETYQYWLICQNNYSTMFKSNFIIYLSVLAKIIGCCFITATICNLWQDRCIKIMNQSCVNWVKLWSLFGEYMLLYLICDINILVCDDCKICVLDAAYQWKNNNMIQILFTSLYQFVLLFINTITNSCFFHSISELYKEIWTDTVMWIIFWSYFFLLILICCIIFYNHYYTSKI